jgi:hypothetical protein
VRGPSFNTETQSDSRPAILAPLNDRYTRSPKLLVAENGDAAACRLMRAHPDIAFSFRVSSTIMNALVQSMSGGTVPDNDVTLPKHVDTAPAATAGPDRPSPQQHPRPVL